MKSSSTELRALARLVLFLAMGTAIGLGMGAGGCISHAPQVMGIPNQMAAALTADDVVPMMRRAGFTDEQILEYGPDLRNLLATSGAAQIRIGDKVEAIFAVDESRLNVSTRSHGNFSLPLAPASVAPPLPTTR